MLAEMRIQGLGVIDDATLELDAGLTVLTGETGAGKTMVVTGLTCSVAAGPRPPGWRTGRAGPSSRGGSPRTPRRWRSRIEVGAEADDDGALIAVRTVGADGRSRAHLGGRAVPGRCAGPAGRLGARGARAERPAAAAAARPNSGRCWTGSPATPWACRCSGTGRCAPSGRRSRPSSSSDGTAARRLAQEADLLRHGLAEIEAVNPQPGEDRELTEEARRLAAADDLREAAGTARAAIAGGDAMDDAAPARSRSSGRPATGSPRPATARWLHWTPSLGDVLAQLDDVAGELTIYLDRLDADPDGSATCSAAKPS